MFSVFSRVSLLILAGAVLFAQQPGSSSAEPALDYLFFKERVQPIFLAALASTFSGNDYLE